MTTGETDYENWRVMVILLVHINNSNYTTMPHLYITLKCPSCESFGAICSIHIELELLENIIHVARPCLFVTTHHPTYLCIIWVDVCHMRLDPRLPFFLVYVEKIGDPGEEARHGMNSEEQQFIRP